MAQDLLVILQSWFSKKKEIQINDEYNDIRRPPGPKISVILILIFFVCSDICSCSPTPPHLLRCSLHLLGRSSSPRVHPRRCYTWSSRPSSWCRPRSCRRGSSSSPSRWSLPSWWNSR